MLPNGFPYEDLYKAILQKVLEEMYALIGASPHAKNQEDDNISFGYTLAKNIEGGLAKAMEIWVKVIDNLLIETDKNDESYAKLWMIRGLKFSEFSLIFSGGIEENEYQHFRGFTFLQLRDKVDRLNFTASYAGDVQTYEHILEQRQIPIIQTLSKCHMPVYMPTSAFEKHAYLTGGTGSGKSELMKLIMYDLQRSSAIKRNRSIVLIDPHGEISPECLGFIMNAKHRDRIIYINPYIHRELKIPQKYTPVINVFDVKDKSDDNINLMTQELTAALMEILQDATLSFQMELLLTMCIATVLRLPDADIKHLVRFMDDQQNADLVALGLKSPSAIHRDFFKTKFKLNEYRQTKISIMTRLTNLLALEEFHQLISGKSTIDLQESIDAGRVLLFNLAQGRLSVRVSSAYGRLIVAYLQGLARKRVDIEKEERMPTFLFIDECQYFLSPSIEEILTGARKFKLFLFFSQQAMGQKMSAGMENLVMSNTAVKIMGKNDKDSYEQFSRNTG
ncbi:MAG: type IV secretory system conjugative DNA transfer family protein, partial [Saprospiraceae bacterium]